MAIEVQDKEESHIKFVDRGHGFIAVAKFDGCIHLNHSNEVCWEDGEEEKILQDDQTQYLHICDVDQMIDFLTKLREQAKSHFGQNWPK